MKTHLKMRFEFVLALALLLAAPGSPAAIAWQESNPAGADVESGESPVAARSPGQQEADRGGSEKLRELDLSNPRATMRAFLLAMQDAAGDHPARIDDAVRCLDLSQLEAEGRAERAQQFALRLHGVIDRIGVKLDDIPEGASGTDWLFYIATVTSGETTAPEIRLVRDPASETWLFSAATIASMGKLEEAVEKADQKKQPDEAADSVAVARRSPRATISTFLEAMNAEKPNVEEAVLCLDPTGQDPKAWGVRGDELAYELKNVMDKIAVVVLAEVPDATDGPPYVWHTGKSGNIVIGRIETEAAKDADESATPAKGEWRFTANTLKHIGALYEELEDRSILAELVDAGVKEQLTLAQRVQKNMPDWLRARVWGVEGWKWFVLLALIPVGWFIRLTATAVVRFVLGRWLAGRKLELEPAALRGVARSLGVVVMVLVWLLVILKLGLPEATLGFLLPVVKLIVALSVVWVAYRFVDVFGGQINADKTVRITQFDDVLIPMLRKILRILVVVVGLVMVADWMGLQLRTILGALGIGGVALAFAAQDTIGNFFGSITVLFDRPFGIGDWIVLGDVEGTVERVGFRSTRVRTFYNSVYTIPNSKMVNTQVDNYGARRFRRIRVMLSLTYSTPPEKIDAFCEGVRELIRLHRYTRKDYYHVYFNQFGTSSLDVLLYCFLETPDWSTELRERHRLFADILRLAKRLDVEFAFPTQTLWLARSPELARSPGAGSGATADHVDHTDADPDTIGFEQAGKVFEDACGIAPAPRGPVIIQHKPRSKSD